MNNQIICRLPGTPTHYPIHIEWKMLDNAAFLVKNLKPHGSKFAIITDNDVAKLYGQKLALTLTDGGLNVSLLSFPPGEQYKTRMTKESLENQLFEDGLGRDTCIITLGGGVVTDLGGYLAATYCRGVPLVIIPTTLMGMVDASIGGKTSVNVPNGKNLIGCIYQPKMVLMDPSTLHTLTAQEMKNGFVEMIKHGLVADSRYFEYLEQNSAKLNALAAESIQSAIMESCRIKKEIIEEDPIEKGRRRILNFGHTVGHALEVLTNYSLAHGRAVATGMLVESYLSVQLGKMTMDDLNRIFNLFKKCDIPFTLKEHFPVERVMDAMILDKKSSKGKPRFVTLEGIGTASYYDAHFCIEIDNKLIVNALNWMNYDLHGY